MTGSVFLFCGLDSPHPAYTRELKFPLPSRHRKRHLQKADMPSFDLHCGSCGMGCPARNPEQNIPSQRHPSITKFELKAPSTHNLWAMKQITRLLSLWACKAGGAEPSSPSDPDVALSHPLQQGGRGEKVSQISHSPHIRKGRPLPDSQPTQKKPPDGGLPTPESRTLLKSTSEARVI